MSKNGGIEKMKKDGDLSIGLTAATVLGGVVGVVFAIVKGVGTIANAAGCILGDVQSIDNRIKEINEEIHELRSQPMGAAVNHDKIKELKSEREFLKNQKKSLKRRNNQKFLK